ncbi:MAG: hypothetical protein L0213_15030 [Candidatus Dadabacteria bacterium]|nr:hypothetical protein [Candidatus Dadabacteria bacterium]
MADQDNSSVQSEKRKYPLRELKEGARKEGLTPEMEALIKEAEEIRLKDEPFERALGRAIRHHYEGKAAYEVYIKVIGAYREKKMV